MITLYIAGPMTGHPEWNYPAFHAAAEELRTACYEVINPAENPPRDTWQEYLRTGIAQIADSAEGMAMLPGWLHSRGAQLEHHIAGQLWLPIADKDEWLRAANEPTA